MESSSCDIASLHCLIQSLEERNKELEELITKQAETITHLQSRITELEARLGLHSGNSSFPPSRDFGPSPKPVNLRKKTGRKAGGQNNVRA